MALTDANIEELVRKCVSDFLKLVSFTHGGRDHGHLRVTAAGLKEDFAHGVSVGTAP